MTEPFEPLTLSLDIDAGRVVVTIRHKVLGHTVATLWYGPERALELSEAIRSAVLDMQQRLPEQAPTHGVLTLSIAALSERGVHSRLWPISEAFAAQIAAVLGDPPSEMLVDAEGAQKVHDASHESGVVFLDQHDHPH